MSPPRRRSARLRGGTPKPKASAPQLSSLREQDETPTKPSPARLNALSSPAPHPATPKSSAIKPSHDEMHPSHAHRSTAEEPSSALRLGFTDIKQPSSATRAGPQATPTKTSVTSPKQFDFNFSRQAAEESQLSDEAQRLMLELREKANQFKADLVAQREAEGLQERKIAKPKGKTGRFSAAHMAEFKKMDSIENHASAWRAQDGRFQPVVSELKRSPSKASLNGPATPEKRSLKRKSGMADLDAPSPSPVKSSLNPSLKRTPSKANIAGSATSTPVKRTPAVATPRRLAHSTAQATAPAPAPVSSAKRMKKREQDDAGSARPVSRDASSLPRPKSSAGPSQTPSTFARLASPTKASMAHSTSPSKPTITLVKSTSTTDLQKTLAKPPTAAVSTSRAAELGRRIISPKSLQRVTSLLRKKNKTDGEESTTAIPKPTASGQATPNSKMNADTDKALPPIPLTTPRRKLKKTVSFTPDTRGYSGDQNSPSPIKTVPSKLSSWRSGDNRHYPSLDGILKKSSSDAVLKKSIGESILKKSTSSAGDAAKKSTSNEVSYPDLSQFKSLADSTSSVSKKTPQSVPGTFNFRSDHTIEFGDAPARGFGASPGQASIRQVQMPGGFPEPTSPSNHPNKENKEPEKALNKLSTVAHGITNKKRHRPTWDEEEAEQQLDDRSAKRRKNDSAPEGQAVVAPRLIARTPSRSASRSATPSRSANKLPAKTPTRTPGSVSPVKKSGGGGLSLSRLQMLARPKNRA